MSIRPIDLFVECPTCKKKFSRFDPNRIELEVRLDNGITDEFIYCSQWCMDSKVNNVNWDKQQIPIIIQSKNRISENPVRWLIECKTDLKVEIL